MDGYSFQGSSSRAPTGSHALDFPNELWMEIFQFAAASLGTLDEFDAVRTEDVETVMHISHVCRAWRHISISLSTLWTCLDLSMPQDATDAFAERSGTALLTVHTRQPLQEQGLMDYMTRLERYSGHLRSLDMILACPSLLDDIQTLVVPHLEQLSVSTVGDWIAYFSFPSFMPNIRRIAMRNIGLDIKQLLMATKGSNLTHLTLSGLESVSWPLETFYEVIVHAANSLVHLDLDYDEALDRFTSKIALVRLQVFRFKGDFYSKEFLASVCTELARISIHIKTLRRGVLFLPGDLSALHAFSRVQTLAFVTHPKKMITARGFSEFDSDWSDEISDNFISHHVAPIVDVKLHSPGTSYLDLIESFPFFDLSRIRALSIETNWPPDKFRQWGSLVVDMYAMEKLFLLGENVADFLLLLYPSRDFVKAEDSESDVQNKLNVDDTGTPCPSLRFLSIEARECKESHDEHGDFESFVRYATQFVEHRQAVNRPLHALRIVCPTASFRIFEQRLTAAVVHLLHLDSSSA